jgi:hypothetical protein
MLGSSLFMEDPDYKYVPHILGAAYIGMGLFMKVSPTAIEKKATELAKDKNKTAIGQVIELKNSERRWRYIGAALFAVPLLFDFSDKGTEWDLHPEDREIMYKTIFASTSIGMLIFKTPFEQLCDEVILGHNKRNISLQFSPGFDKNSLAVVYNF